jgi:hypothetical protein
VPKNWDGSTDHVTIIKGERAVAARKKEQEEAARAGQASARSAVRMSHRQDRDSRLREMAAESEAKNKAHRQKLRADKDSKAAVQREKDLVMAAHSKSIKGVKSRIDKSAPMFGGTGVFRRGEQLSPPSGNSPAAIESGSGATSPGSSPSAPPSAVSALLTPSGGSRANVKRDGRYSVAKGGAAFVVGGDEGDAGGGDLGSAAKSRSRSRSRSRKRAAARPAVAKGRGGPDFVLVQKEDEIAAEERERQRESLLLCSSGFVFYLMLWRRLLRFHSHSPDSLPPLLILSPRIQPLTFTSLSPHRHHDALPSPL